MDKVLVAGLGNPLMGDEGIGVRLVHNLQQRMSALPHVDFMDMGTGGLSVLHAIAGRPKVVFVDCAFMDEPPGTIRRFTPDSVASTKAQWRTSAHEGDLLAILELSRSLGECPPQVVIFGIQPASVEPRIGLSPAVEARLGEYAELIAREVG